MIRNINQVYLKKAVASLQPPLTRMTYLQTATLLLILFYLLLEQLSRASTQYLHQLLVAFWIVGELVASLLFSSIRQMVRSGTTCSQQAKQEIGTMRAYLIALKHVKFLNILCNFLALLAQIKAMRRTGQIQTDFYWSLVYLPMALFSLSLTNALLSLFQKILDIYNNFEMEPDEEDLQSVI